MTKKEVTYIGEKEIQKIKKNEVLFTDGSVGQYTDTQLSYLVTKVPCDPTQLRDLVLDNIVPEMMGLLEKHDIRKGDLGSILDTVVGSFNNFYGVALGKAFGTFNESSPRQSFQEDVRISDMKRVME